MVIVRRVALAGLALTTVGLSQALASSAAPGGRVPITLEISPGIAHAPVAVMACQQVWFINGAFEVEPRPASREPTPQTKLQQQLSIDLGRLLPLEQQLSEQPTTQSPDDVLRWAGLRQAVLRDLHRLRQVSAPPVRQPAQRARPGTPRPTCG